MKKYKVQLKGNKKSQIVEAYGHTLKDAKRYFHKKEDLSDFDSFFLEKDISSMDEIPPFKGFTPISIE